MDRSCHGAAYRSSHSWLLSFLRPPFKLPLASSPRTSRAPSNRCCLLYIEPGGAMAALIFPPTASMGPSPARCLRSRPFPSSAGLPCLRTASLLSSSRCSPSPAPVASFSASASSRRKLQPRLVSASVAPLCRSTGPSRSSSAVSRRFEHVNPQRLGLRRRRLKLHPCHLAGERRRSRIRKPVPHPRPS